MSYIREVFFKEEGKKNCDNLRLQEMNFESLLTNHKGLITGWIPVHLKVLQGLKYMIDILITKYAIFTNHPQY